MTNLNKNSFTALILAGGEGRRFSSKTPKQFCELAKNFLVIEKSLETISTFASKTIIALFPEQFNDENLKSKLKKIGELKESEILFVLGGKTRQESVENCLSLVDSEYLFIHDAARPLIHPEDVKRLLDHTLLSQAAILGKPLTDTVKLVTLTPLEKNSQTVINKTLDRSLLWAAETPQAFNTELFRKAFKNAKQSNFLGTDDASILENCGFSVYFVESKHPNFKITHPLDLELAKMVLEKQGHK